MFWVLYFLAARAIFLLYHSSRTQQLSTEDLYTIFSKGLRLDLSFSGYVSAIPFLAILATTLFPGLRVRRFIRYYTYTTLALLSVLMAVDLELYTFWGFRLDSTPLLYLNTPGEMAASAASAPVLLLVVIALGTSLVFALLFRYTFDYQNYHLNFSKVTYAGIALTFAAVLILPMRGGWQQIPINQSVVYFSENPYANHAGLNMPWNLMNTMLKYNQEARNPYQYMEIDEAEALVSRLYQSAGDSAERILQVERPNVLFIILESYTAKFIGHLGGEQGVTPNLDRIAAEGMSFMKMYASGDRSEKGMVALLSGYPVQTTTSIIKNPKKTEQLPHLSQVFKQAGYSTGFYYGGELEFANIRSYLQNGGYDRLIDKYDFPEESYNSKWGAHDHVLFDRVLQDLKEANEPFFTTVYTLSSHEPFETPIPAKFPGTSVTDKFRNSVYYTDWALGRFMEEARQQPWWDSTLIVLVADHGHPLPYEDPNHLSTKFRIPFVLAGGALSAKGKQVKELASQTDIATTLLYQLSLPYRDFKWGRNLLAPTDYPFAFYVFNDGFGFITPGTVFSFDNVSQKPILRGKGLTKQQLEYGKAYMQSSFEDFVRK
ncbi:sulfatase-like hydrolase/transferase [Pontibacter sp. JH31]|uniref:Sulfatase-like hydrolase/transferase n=1 Tax=Pontibacter aquaedesilientis TaxID=2766980 RepID=A0ABR7XD67_9BACT|nr:alkaline phosphatase family protein [Pontibacter aquaedesilientis]MBD1396248.1 sulfatase-like hydrolase/transferase [Pontibacter aquaedesilientis]